jgi:hypothetical protein
MEWKYCRTLNGLLRAIERNDGQHYFLKFYAVSPIPIEGERQLILKNGTNCIISEETYQKIKSHLFYCINL